MTRLLGRVGLVAFVAFGLFVVAVPEYMPHVGVPYDKFLHVGVFALATLCAVASVRDRRAALALAAVIVIAGIGVELVQSMVPGRSADTADAAANALGVLVVLAGYFLLRRGGRDASGDLVERQVLDAYRRERARGQPQAACLGAAAEAYRMARPGVPEHDIRLQVVRLIEDKAAR